MSFVEVRLPPGVLSLMTTAAAPSRARPGRSRPRGTWPCAWSTMPVVGRTTTCGPSARAEREERQPSDSATSPMDRPRTGRRALVTAPVDMVRTTST